MFETRKQSKACSRGEAENHTVDFSGLFSYLDVIFPGSRISPVRWITCFIPAVRLHVYSLLTIIDWLFLNDTIPALSGFLLTKMKDFLYLKHICVNVLSCSGDPAGMITACFLHKAINSRWFGEKQECLLLFFLTGLLLFFLDFLWNG